MNRKRSEIEGRRMKLLDIIRHTECGSAELAQISQLLNVSEITLRRDLTQLEQQGLIVRSYGRVALAGTKRAASLDGQSDPSDRIAARAADFVEAGDIIFVNTSSTALRMLQHIDAPNVTVITNNILAANAPHRSDMTIVLTGGEIRYPKYAMVGDVAQRTLQSVKANRAFLGCSGLSVKNGMTTEFLGEVRVNNLMLTHVSGPVYMLAGHAKLNWDSNFVSGDISLIHTLITDKAAAPELLAPFQARHIRVLTV